MPRPPLRAMLVALIAAVVALMAAGCGGDDSGDDQAAGLTAQELLERSAEQAREAESFRIDFTATGAVDLSDPGSVPGGPLLAGDLDISGEGPVQPPDRASIDVRVALAGPTLQGNVTRVGEEVFLGVLGQDFRVDLPPEQVALLDLGALYPTVAGWAVDPVDAGREEIDGTPTAKVTAAIDPERALAALGPALPIEGLTPERARAVLSEGSLEAWIGTDDLLPRRARVVLRGDASGLGAGVRAIDLDLAADLSAYGEPVDIQPPRDPRELDLSQLGSLAGG